MSYKGILALGLGILAASALLLAFNFNSLTVLGAAGRVFGGLLILPSGVLIFDGIAKGRSLYIFNIFSVDHIAFWHKDSADKKDKP